MPLNPIEKLNCSDVFVAKKTSVNCPCFITDLNNNSVTGVGTL